MEELLDRVRASHVTPEKRCCSCRTSRTRSAPNPTRTSGVLHGHGLFGEIIARQIWRFHREGVDVDFLIERAIPMYWALTTVEDPSSNATKAVKTFFLRRINGKKH